MIEESIFSAPADVVLTACVSLGWLLAMFVPLERAFAARRQPFLRRGFGTDLLFFFGQHLLFGAAAAALLTTAVTPVAGWTAPLSDPFGELPLAVQLVVVVLAGDFCAYWGHRLQHRVPLLWRLHAVHHSNEDIDFLAAHREHPLDGLYTQLMVNLPAFVLGFDIGAVLGLLAFRSLWAIFIHTNVRLPLGPLRYVVGSPNLHRWHHAKDRTVGNYANLAPWLDLLFGTFVEPDHEPAELGVDEPMPGSYLGLLVLPLLPRFAWPGRLAIVAAVLSGCAQPATEGQSDADVGASDVAQRDMGRDAGDSGFQPETGMADLTADQPGLSTTAENYCELTVDVFCPYYVRCGRMAVASVEECREVFLEACNEVYEPHYSRYAAVGALLLSDGGIEACRTHLETVSCDQQLFDLDGGCAEIWQGLLSPGDPCAPGIGSFVCKEGSECVLDLDFCGTCKVAAAIGQPCGGEITCEGGSRCQGGVCVARSAVGGACDDETPCVLGASCEAGVCVGFDIVSVGEACDAGRRCPYHATCRGGLCVENAGLGGDCTAASCDSGWCDGAQCQPFLEPGEACESAMQCVSLACVGGTCADLIPACFR